MPRKPDPDGKKVVMSFRITPENRDKLLKKAADTGRSMSAVVNEVLAKSTRKP